MRGSISRREIVQGIGALGGIALTAGPAACGRSYAMTEKHWQLWQADWKRMEAVARKRGWEVTPLKIARPATEREITALEKRHKQKMPPQLRELLSQYSKEVSFGWRIPQHLRPMERVEHLYPTSGGIRDHIWSLDHIDQYAIGNFLGWKRDLATADLREAQNAPEMWNNQFAIGDLPNGDMLTIDVSKPDPTQQPVRYFSHEVEGLHGFELAPDLFSFLSVYSALGCVGSTHDDWFSFIPARSDAQRLAHLSATGEGAMTWFAWRDGGIDDRHPDDPPPAVVETTAADRALLNAARANLLPAVVAALAAGAKPDCVPSSDWQMDSQRWHEEFSTALSYATHHNNIAMIERLIKAGATLNTRQLPLNVAVKVASLDTVRWLIANGARVNGWRHQRYWPLHDLVVTRGVVAAKSREEYRQELVGQANFLGGDMFDKLIASAPDEETRQSYREAKKLSVGQTRAALAEVDKRLEVHIDGKTYDAMLETLLGAGANPDAPWDNGITMLMWGGVATGRILLAHGANVHARDNHGATAFFHARTPEKVRLLAAHGGDINAHSTPNKGDRTLHAKTPLQSTLMADSRQDLTLAKTYLELGADPKIRDGAGRSSLAYCFSAESFKLIIAYGLDPKERLPSGGTLLHNLATMSHAPRADVPVEVEFFKFLLGLGLDINAHDDLGRTMLHYAAERESYDENGPNFELLIARGADKSIKDKSSKRAFDLAAKSLKKVRAVLN